jgi:NAD(P)-dependent dehydrogenase (short-subunit alcohol dehydrogenase family)
LINAAKFLSQYRGSYRFYKCDLRDFKLLKNTVGEISRDFGRINLLVNNAGIIRQSDFLNITPAAFDDILAVNLKAPLFLSKYCYKLFRGAEDPQIINIASLGGIMNWSRYMAYSISKTALIKLTHLLARSLAPEIRVNAIAPGTIVIYGEETGKIPKIGKDKIPLKRYGKPGNITEAVKFLLNCDYINGQVLTIDGGRSINF